MDKGDLARLVDLERFLLLAGIETDLLPAVSPLFLDLPLSSDFSLAGGALAGERLSLLLLLGGVLDLDLDFERDLDGRDGRLDGGEDLDGGDDL